MSEEIVIRYKEETLKVEDFTEREKAIYDEAYRRGAISANSNKYFITVFFAMIIIVLIVESFNH